MLEGKHMTVTSAGKQRQTIRPRGRAYPHRIPLVKLKGMSEKRNSELADRLLQSRADGSRYHFRSWPRLTSL